MQWKSAEELCTFKGLKNVPKCNVSSNIVVAVSMGGAMKEELMLDWCNSVFKAMGSFLCNEDSLLLIDSHGSRMHKSVKKELEAMKVKIKYIPAKTTSYLQPLDVSVNSPFKTSLRNQWNLWFEKEPKEYTSRGDRKRPSYAYLLKLVSEATKKIEKEVVVRGFECCGIAPEGNRVPIVIKWYA